MAPFTVVGTGSIGEKARQLQEKGPELEKIGFRLPPRLALSSDYLAEALDANGISDPWTRTESSKRFVSEENFILPHSAPIQKFLESCSSNYCAVRSSAECDARGTGVYASHWALKTLDPRSEHALQKTIRRVLASYFTQSAAGFRRDIGAGPGMGVIVEPFISMKFPEEDDLMLETPMLSGHGYTSTLRNDGVVNIVPGFGGGVSSRDVIRATRADSLDSIGSCLSEAALAQRRENSWVDSCRLRALGSREVQGVWEGDTHGGFLPFAKDLVRDMADVDLRPLFAMMTQMESAFGAPQYFEFVGTKERDEMVFWITQIADAQKNPSLIEFTPFEAPILRGCQVTGTGFREGMESVVCRYRDELPALQAYNRKHKDYLLLYSSDLTANHQSISYEDISNAAALMEFIDKPHSASPISHWDGMLASSRKLFSVFLEPLQLYRTASDFDRRWDELTCDMVKTPEGLLTYSTPIKVIADERADEMLVAKMP